MHVGASLLVNGPNNSGPSCGKEFSHACLLVNGRPNSGPSCGKEFSHACWGESAGEQAA